MRNIEELQELIQRYQTITIEEIQITWEKSDYKNGHSVAQTLTGFGGNSHCSLCLAVENKCEECVYVHDSNDDSYHCLNTLNRPSYNGIDHARTPLQLFKGYRNRAEHLKTRYKDIL